MSHLLRPVLTAACGCALRRWKIDISHRFAGVTILAEIRPQ
jgi:hypothetical protein